VQPPELLIEIEKSGCHTDGLATALESCFGVADGVCQRGSKCAKPALQLAHGGEIKEPFFRTLDLLAGRIVEILTEGFIDHILAKCDQLPPLVEIIDNSAVVFGVDDRDCSGSKPCQVLRSANRRQRGILVEKTFERDRVGPLTAFNHLGDGGKNPTMYGITEMLGLQEFGDPKIGRVVD